MKQKFNKEIAISDISIREADAISINRATGMKTMKHCFQLLKKFLADNELYDKNLRQYCNSFKRGMFV